VFSGWMFHLFLVIDSLDPKIGTKVLDCLSSGDRVP